MRQTLRNEVGMIILRMQSFDRGRKTFGGVWFARCALPDEGCAFTHFAMPKNIFITVRNPGHLWKRKLLTTTCENHVVFRTLSVVYRPDGSAICGLCGDGEGLHKAASFSPGLGRNKPLFHMPRCIMV